MPRLKSENPIFSLNKTFSSKIGRQVQTKLAIKTLVGLIRNCFRRLDPSESNLQTEALEVAASTLSRYELTAFAGLI